MYTDHAGCAELRKVWTSELLGCQVVLCPTGIVKARSHGVLVTASDLPQVRAKVAAMEMLKGQRADLGLQRAWEGNYLASVSPEE